MLIRELELHNFRNYQEAEIHFPAGVSLIEGENGQGKTNILEAIYYLAAQRSWRASRDESIVRQGCATARIAALVETRRGNQLRIAVGLGEEREAVVNNTRDPRRRQLAGVVTATLFAPEDLEIVKGPPGGRRDYIDALVVKLRPARAGAVSDFARVLRQRNGLLKSAAATRKHDTGTLDVWDSQLATKGEALVSARRDALRAAMKVAEGVYKQACEPGTEAELRAEYSCSFDETGTGSAAALEEALKAVRPEELRRGLTLAGPHHDDIAISINGLDARTRASQGEQRTVALALRLAEHESVAEASGEEGILLLDDVFSELDSSRSRLLVERLESAQSILTSAGILPSEIRERISASYAVKRGHVEQRS